MSLTPSTDDFSWGCPFRRWERSSPRIVEIVLRGLWFLAAFSRVLAAESFVVLNDDGGWNWLQDKRALVVGDLLFVGSVATGHREPGRMGDVEAVICNLRTRSVRRQTLRHEPASEKRRFWRDDHCSPVFADLGGGRVLAMAAMHNHDSFLRVWTYDPSSAAWQTERLLALSADSRTAFPNLIRAAAAGGVQPSLLAFFRGYQKSPMPAWIESIDDGFTWSEPRRLFDLAPKIVAYTKYAAGRDDSIYFACADGHRNAFGNAIFVGKHRRAESTATGNAVEAATGLTEVFRANPDSVVMINDLTVDELGHPCVLYSVQMNTRSRRPRQAPSEHSYRYARWDGTRWQEGAIAHAGTEVHPTAPDDDCTGLASFAEGQGRLVYISTNADPVTAVPLVSSNDGQRHWEIFRGSSSDGGVTWVWSPVTAHSITDNIRPVAPRVASGGAPIVWLRGSMRLPTDYRLQVVAQLPSANRP